MVMESYDPTSFLGSLFGSSSNSSFGSNSLDTNTVNTGSGFSSLGLGTGLNTSPNSIGSIGGIGSSGIGSLGNGGNNFGFGSLNKTGVGGENSIGLFQNADGSTNLGGIAKLLAGIGGLFGSFNEGRNAKKALNFTKDAFYKQNAQNVQQYNTVLEDTANRRFNVEGKSDTARDTYIDKNRL